MSFITFIHNNKRDAKMYKNVLKQKPWTNQRNKMTAIYIKITYKWTSTVSKRNGGIRLNVFWYIFAFEVQLRFAPGDARDDPGGDRVG